MTAFIKPVVSCLFVCFDSYQGSLLPMDVTNYLKTLWLKMIIYLDGDFANEVFGLFSWAFCLCSLRC